MARTDTERGVRADTGLSATLSAHHYYPGGHPMTKRSAAIAALTMLTLGGLAGCASSEPAPTVTVTVTAPAPEASTPAAVEGEPATHTGSDSGAEPGVAAFGTTVTLPDKEGTITISAPKPFTPSKTASAGDWDEYVVMDVTEVNDSAKPDMAGWVIRATTGSKEAEPVFDSENGITTPTVDIMPGKSITYKVAFGRTKGADFVLSANTLAGSHTAYFQ